MTVTSYAQNFEDVILWRALKHVDRGTYIDIGAQDPMQDSVSLLFYEHGWRGVHVEPVPLYADKLREKRPDERVVQALIGPPGKLLGFYEVAGTGMSTGDRHIAEQHQARGHSIKRIDVPSLPLSQILDEYIDQDVHWLKIDVEGMEEQVIRTWSPSTVRPWIVCIESTEPNRSVPNFSGWEPELLSLGYNFVYFDGLNRFYVSNAHPHLENSFGAGPNFFDDFILNERSYFCRNVYSDVVNLRQQLSATGEWADRLKHQISQKHDEIVSVTGRAQAAEAKAQAAEAKVQALQERIALLENELTAVYQSASWFATAPLRWLVDGASAWITLKPGSRPHRVADHIIISLANEVIKRPRLAALTKRLLSPMPQLRGRLRARMHPRTESYSPLSSCGSNINTESEVVRRIYGRLKQARKLNSHDK